VADWSRYEACTKCQALGGEPCRSLAPQHTGTIVAVSEPHSGRPKVSTNGQTATVAAVRLPAATVVAVDPDPVPDPAPVAALEEPEAEPVFTGVEESPKPRRTWDWILISCTSVVTLIGSIAATVSYVHALEVSKHNGLTNWTIYLTPLTIDGLVYVASMALLVASRSGRAFKELWLAYLGLWLGVAATISVNVLYGWRLGPIAAVLSAWPALTLVIATHLLQWLLRKHVINRQS
jgi:hypothetical protein